VRIRFNKLFLSFLAHNGSPLVHSLPQLTSSPVMRRHAGQYISIDNSSKSSTVPSFMTARPDLDQLHHQLQQRLNQQRVRNERDMVDWRPVSDIGVTVDTQSVTTPPAFSRYSAPPIAGMLAQSSASFRPTDKMTTANIPSALQHPTAALSSSSSSSSAAVKPGQSLPAAARSQSSVSAKSGASSSCTPSVTSSAALGRNSPVIASQHVRSDTTHFLLYYRNFHINRFFC